MSRTLKRTSRQGRRTNRAIACHRDSPQVTATHVQATHVQLRGGIFVTTTQAKVIAFVNQQQALYQRNPRDSEVRRALGLGSAAAGACSRILNGLRDRGLIPPEGRVWPREAWAVPMTAAAAVPELPTLVGRGR